MSREGDDLAAFIFTVIQTRARLVRTRLRLTLTRHPSASSPFIITTQQLQYFWYGQYGNLSRVQCVFQSIPIPRQKGYPELAMVEPGSTVLEGD